jgi:fatty acid desaturase
MIAYPLAKWLLQVIGLYVVFTVQGAMWKGAQDENRNGWVIALLWSVAVATLYIPMHELLHQLFVEQRVCNP